VASRAEVVGDGTIRGHEALRLCRCLDPRHTPLPLAGGRMGGVSPLVPRAVLAGLHTRKACPLRRTGALELVRDAHPWHVGPALEPLADERLGGGLVPARLDQASEDVAVLIHGPPQRVAGPIDGEAHLIQVPRIAGPGGPPTPLIGLLLPEFHTPLPAGFVGHDAPTGEPQLFDIPIPEAKAAVQPDAITDEFSREAVISCSPFCGTSSRVWPSAEVVSATCTVRFSPRACSVIRWRSDRRRRAAAYWAGACHRPTLRVYRTLGGSAYADCTTRRTRSTVAGSESAASNLPSGRTHLPHGRF
jgi:hypothetical protein